MADPGFPVGGGVDLVGGGVGLPRRLCFENFVCQNERIGTLRGGRAPGAPPRSANEICQMGVLFMGIKGRVLFHASFMVSKYISLQCTRHKHVLMYIYRPLRLQYL